jgi:4-amino-4-deoxy-L-arabinose transferase-like glycosyltransferase
LSSALPQGLWLMLLGNTLLHCLLGWALGLSGDEAHYALYASHLALSYYDHPPLVGWIQWPLVALHAPDGLLRLIPEMLWLMTGWGVFSIARQLHSRLGLPHTVSGDAAGLWAVAAFSLAPLLHILGIGLLPDTLLMALTAAIIWQTLRLLEVSQLSSLRAWVVLGVLLGLAGLSKYTAIFAALAVILCLSGAHGLRWLKFPGPWLALLLALLIVSPVFIWNAQHDWISFAYQLKHGAGNPWQASQVGIFLLAQVLVYGPLLLLGLMVASPGMKAAFGAGAQGKGAWLLVFFALPFAVLAYLSGGGTGLPHWTAPAWVALSPFAGLGLAQAWGAGKRRLIMALAGLQTLACLVLLSLMALAGNPWASADAAHETQNPFTDFHGWDAAGEAAVKLAQDHGQTRLAVQNWTLASRLAWYARPLPVHVLDPGFDQFSIWSGDLPKGSSAILMDWSQMAYVLPVGAGQFAQCTPLQEQAVQSLQRRVASFSFYLCSNWGGEPAPVRKPRPHQSHSPLNSNSEAAA